MVRRTNESFIPAGFASQATSIRKHVQIVPLLQESAKDCSPIIENFTKTYLQHSNAGNHVPASVQFSLLVNESWLAVDQSSPGPQDNSTTQSSPVASSKVSEGPESLVVTEFVIIVTRSIMDAMPKSNASDLSSQDLPLLSASERYMDAVRQILNLINGRLARVVLLVPNEEDTKHHMICEIGCTLRSEPASMDSVSWLGSLAESALLSFPPCHAIIDSSGNTLNDFGNASIAWDGSSFIPLLHKEAPLLIFGSLGSAHTDYLEKIQGYPSDFNSVNVTFDKDLSSIQKLMAWWTSKPKITLMASLGTSFGILTLPHQGHFHAVLTFLTDELLPFEEHGISGLRVARKLLFDMKSEVAVSVDATRFDDITTLNRTGKSIKSARHSLDGPARGRSRSNSRASLDAGPGTRVAKSTASSRRDGSRGRLSISRALVRNKFSSKKVKDSTEEAGEILASLCRRPKNSQTEGDRMVVDITNNVGRSDKVLESVPQVDSELLTPADEAEVARERSHDIENLPVERAMAISEPITAIPSQNHGVRSTRNVSGSEASSTRSHVADPTLLIPHHIHEKFKHVREPEDLKNCVTRRARAFAPLNDGNRSSFLDYAKIRTGGVARKAPAVPKPDLTNGEESDVEDTLAVDFCRPGSTEKDQEVSRYEKVNIEEEFRSVVNQDLLRTPVRMDLSDRLRRMDNSKTLSRTDWKKAIADRPKQDASRAQTSLFRHRTEISNPPSGPSRKGRSSGARQLEQLRANEAEKNPKATSKDPSRASVGSRDAEPFKLQNDRAMNQIAGDFLILLIKDDSTGKLRAKGTKVLRESVWAYLNGITEGSINAKPINTLKVSRFCSVNAPLVAADIMNSNE